MFNEASKLLTHAVTIFGPAGVLLTIALAVVAFLAGLMASIYIIKFIADYLSSRSKEQSEIINDQQQRLNRVERHVTELRAEIRELRKVAADAEKRRERAIIKLIDCKAKQKSIECKECLDEVHDILTAVNY